MRLGRCRLFVALMVYAAVSLAAPPLLAQETATTASVWDGIYTEAQAERGKTAYEASCKGCHGANPAVPTGATAGPPLAGKNFMLFWKGRTVGELYDFAREQMPQGRPGSLPPETYADIIAYVFSESAFPAGEAELPADSEALAKILIEPNPAQ